MSAKKTWQDNGEEFAHDEIALLGFRVDPKRGVAEVRAHAIAENQVFLFEVRIDRDLKSGALRTAGSRIIDQVKAQLATIRSRDTLMVLESRKNLSKGPQSVSKRKLLPEAQTKANAIRSKCRSLTRTAVVNQIAGDLSISESTIWGWVKSGDLRIPRARA